MDTENQSTTANPPESVPIKTYSLEEVAAMVLPVEWSDGARWLQRRLARGEFSGYKVGRVWRMTHADVEDFIERSRNKPRPMANPETVETGGLTQRSWQYRQRYGMAGNPNLQGPRKNWQREPAAQSIPCDDYRKVQPAPAAVIANMSPLSDSQQALLDRVRTEGTVSVRGTGTKRTVEALALRNLVTYEVAQELNEKWRYYAYTFTVRLKDSKEA
ncbi:helix-turn-helix domain-containing protein [Mycolicibacterium wolinskyi]|uniref:helix-turn-helix domain-containing protein n=1 Tax=Mycolicibacterium wolinskyi TaxID=59750 RepID=UPI00391787C6